MRPSWGTTDFGPRTHGTKGRGRKRRSGEEPSPAGSSGSGSGLVSGETLCKSHAMIDFWAPQLRSFALPSTRHGDGSTANNLRRCGDDFGVGHDRITDSSTDSRTGNIEDDTTPEHLASAFAPFGSVTEVQIPPDPQLRQSIIPVPSAESLLRAVCPQATGTAILLS